MSLCTVHTTWNTNSDNWVRKCGVPVCDVEVIGRSESWRMADGGFESIGCIFLHLSGEICLECADS